MTTYDVKCPKCGGLASAEMRPAGTAGTYRESRVEYVARRLVCPVCGFNATSDTPIPYELWYKVTVGDFSAWARNRSHAEFLVGYLSGSLPSNDVDRRYVETLPGWMLEPKNRAMVLKRMQALLAGGNQ